MSAALAVAVSALAAGGALAQDPSPAPGGDDAAQTGGESTGGVAAIQRALGLEPDGVYGPRTRAAVRRFQRSRDLAVDGVAGPQTLAALGVEASAAGAGQGDGPSASSGASGASLAKIAQCESGGNPAAVSPDGQYRGKYQFSRATWRRLGGTGDPAAAPEAEQDRLAAQLLAQAGTSPWPACG